MLNYYILFDNHEQAIKMHRDLQKAEVASIITPTPRNASLCCGVSLRVKKEDYMKLENFLKLNTAVYREVKEIEENFNPKRDVYL